MAYRLYACSVCDTTVPLQLQFPLVALCVMPLPLQTRRGSGQNQSQYSLHGGMSRLSGLNKYWDDKT